MADITETKPNVMWESGFAMALGKPVIVITQSLADLPFDIRDMQAIEIAGRWLGQVALTRERAQQPRTMRLTAEYLPG